jgi:hypothetical protein
MSAMIVATAALRAVSDMWESLVSAACSRLLYEKRSSVSHRTRPSSRHDLLLDRGSVKAFTQRFHEGMHC